MGQTSARFQRADPLVFNVSDPTLEGDAATRQYVDSIMHRSEDPSQVHIEGGGSIRFDQEALDSLQLQPTGVIFRQQPEVLNLSGPSGGSITINSGSGLQSSNWGSVTELRLDLPNDDDFRRLQNDTSLISRVLTELVGRVERVEQENRDLRTLLDTLEFNIRTRR